MKTADYIRKMRTAIQILKSGKPVAIASQDTHVMMTERIFEKGKNSQNSDIGKYDDSKGLYVNPNVAPRKFRPAGKNSNKAKFKNGNERKTRYFKSYKSYRQAVGRSVGKVNLVLTGNLQSDFGKAVTKVNNLKYTATARSENEKKIEGQEERYGKIFELTKKEKKNFKDVLYFEVEKLLK